MYSFKTLIYVYSNGSLLGLCDRFFSHDEILLLLWLKLKLHDRSPFADLSRCQRTLAKSLNEFNFECIGANQTDDEQIIADSLKQFGKLIFAIEDERDNMVSWTTAPLIN